MRENRIQGYSISPLNEMARTINSLEHVMSQLYFMDRQAGIEEKYETIYMNVIHSLRRISTELQLHFELEKMEQKAEAEAEAEPEKWDDMFMNLPEGIEGC